MKFKAALAIIGVFAGLFGCVVVDKEYLSGLEKDTSYYSKQVSEYRERYSNLADKVTILDGEIYSKNKNGYWVEVNSSSDQTGAPTEPQSQTPASKDITIIDGKIYKKNAEGYWFEA